MGGKVENVGAYIKGGGPTGVSAPRKQPALDQVTPNHNNDYNYNYSYNYNYRYKLPLWLPVPCSPALRINESTDLRLEFIFGG